MKSPGSWSAISLANSNYFFAVYILVVIGSRRGTRNLARLYVGVLIADIIGLKVDNYQPTVCGLYKDHEES